MTQRRGKINTELVQIDSGKWGNGSGVKGKWKRKRGKWKWNILVKKEKVE